MSRDKQIEAQSKLIAAMNKVSNRSMCNPVMMSIDEWNDIVAKVKRVIECSPLRGEPLDKFELMNVLDELYSAGYTDAKGGRDYDPRGTREWQDVVDFIENHEQCQVCNGEGHVYEGGMSMNPEVDNQVPCPKRGGDDDE